MVFLQLFLVLIPICSSSTSISTSTNTSAVAEDIGILVIGGWSSSQSIEFWSNPEEGSCQLNDYPREMYSPTANLVSGQLVACYGHSCEIYNGGGEWTHLVDTLHQPTHHSSAVKDDRPRYLLPPKDDRILLIGDPLTEWISMDGSPSQPGPYYGRHGQRHCTIQLSSNLIVLTGGEFTGHFVTRYRLSEGGYGDPTPLGPMNNDGFMDERYGHACGVYQRAGGQQVRRL